MGVSNLQITFCLNRGARVWRKLRRYGGAALKQLMHPHPPPAPSANFLLAPKQNILASAYRYRNFEFHIKFIEGRLIPAHFYPPAWNRISLFFRKIREQDRLAVPEEWVQVKISGWREISLPAAAGLIVSGWARRSDWLQSNQWNAAA